MPRSKLRASDVTALPIVAALGADITVDTVTKDLFALPLPAAGSYLVEVVLLIEPGALAASRDLTASLNATNCTAMSLVGLWLRNGATPTVYAGATGTPQAYVLAHTANLRTRLLVHGLVVVSAPAVFTVTGVISAETAAIKVPSAVRAWRYA